MPALSTMELTPAVWYDMNDIHQKLIDAVIRKAELLCPDSLALIGVYGSCATGDTHAKSDLDLLILINDARGLCLADTFILDDTDVGYDLYCTRWDMLEGDAECQHAHLSKLLDSSIVYVKEPEAMQRLEDLRSKARSLLASDVRIPRAMTSLENAKASYADSMLTDSLSRARTFAGAVIYHLLNALMLYNGRYFRKGVKRTFEEIDELGLPFSAKALILAVIQAQTVENLRITLTELMRTVRPYFASGTQKAQPSPSNLTGTYEEMYSNWRNKMWEAADRGDLFSSFMNAVSCRFMLEDIAEAIAVDLPDVIAGFDPGDLQRNARLFEDALDRYLDEYRKIGIQPKHFANADAYLSAYPEQ